MFAFEISDKVAAIPDVDHAHASQWFAQINIDWGRVESKVRGDIQLNRHSNASNYLFLDGHVETISEDQILRWIDGNFKFAKPDEQWINQ
nr:H-X9-DG-CTERM domain-containing protein [Bythopirellula goksoeyrii]